MTTIFAASTGGHLSQLIELSSRMSGVDGALWVTFDAPQSRSLLKGRRTKFIRSIEERDVLGVCLGALSARRIVHLEANPSAVISTGSAIALSFLPYAAVRGISAHYIESAARVGTPSLTGRILERVPGINLYRQYPHASTGSWRYAGSVFDGFESTVISPRQVKKIVVTFGSGEHTFRRLLERLVTIMPKEMDVLWQTGSTSVQGVPIHAQPFVPASALREAIRQADVVIGHAGCGTALEAMNAGKFPVLIPREPEYGELVDSHQIELARWLAKQDLALYKNPKTLALNDIFEAAARAIVRRSNPPAMNLA